LAPRAGVSGASENNELGCQTRIKRTAFNDHAASSSFGARPGTCPGFWGWRRSAALSGAPVSFSAPQTKRCVCARTGAVHVLGAGAAGSRLTGCRIGRDAWGRWRRRRYAPHAFKGVVRSGRIATRELDDLLKLVCSELGRDLAYAPLMQQHDGRYDRLGHILGGGPTKRYSCNPPLADSPRAMPHGRLRAKPSWRLGAARTVLSVLPCARSAGYWRINLHGNRLVRQDCRMMQENPKTLLAFLAERSPIESPGSRHVALKAQSTMRQTKRQ